VFETVNYKLSLACETNNFGESMTFCTILKALKETNKELGIAAFNLERLKWLKEQL